jgi:cytidine deaminase
MRRGRKRTKTSLSEPRAAKAQTKSERAEALVALARSALGRARSPYSNLRVGAAVRDVDGRVFTGCNIENASFGLTLCAERVAVFKAVSEGAGRLVGLAVVTERRSLVMPCGACRQVLLELAPDLAVIVAAAGSRRRKTSLRRLLPDAFEAADLA